MNTKYTAVIKQDGDWWIGWIEEIPGVNCQEATHDELIESLRITLREALAFNREEALAITGAHNQEELFADVDMADEEIDNLFARDKDAGRTIDISAI